MNEPLKRDSWPRSSWRHGSIIGSVQVADKQEAWKTQRRNVWDQREPKLHQREDQSNWIELQSLFIASFHVQAEQYLTIGREGRLGVQSNRGSRREALNRREEGAERTANFTSQRKASFYSSSSSHSRAILGEETKVNGDWYKPASRSKCIQSSGRTHTTANLQLRCLRYLEGQRCHQSWRPIHRHRWREERSRWDP